MRSASFLRIETITWSIWVRNLHFTLHVYLQRKIGVGTFALTKDQYLIIIGDTEITDPHELSSAFNRHFTDIGPNFACNINPPRVSFRDFVEACDSTFSNSLIIHKRKTKEITTVKEVWICGLD